MISSLTRTLATCLLLVAINAPAQDGGETILIRNVVLGDQEGGTEPLVVNILVRDRLLELISEDLIPLDEADEAYDAGGGMVMGQLKLGEPASFMILDGDPRDNIDVLLDTKVHATFAIRRGEVVRNRFVMILEETPEERERSQGGWLAYAPPPLAVPLDYNNTDKWNRFESRWVSGIAAGAVVLDRQYWVDQNSDSEQQVGELESFEGGEIRGLRFGAVGTINFQRPWVWTLFGATHAFDKGFDTETTDNASFFDVRLDIPVWEKASFSIGKQKEPISMERIMSMVYLPMQERSAAADALLPSRNVGLVMAGNLLGDRMTLAGGLFNDWLDKDQPNSFSDNSSQAVGRATWVPYQSDNHSTLLHLGMGFRYSDGVEGGQTGSEPEFNQAPLYVETPLLELDDLNSLQAEASLRSGPFWLHSEYIGSRVDTTRYGDLDFSGYNVTASWILTGEVRPYNHRVGIFSRMPISRTVDQNGRGAWEAAVRFSNTDLSDGAIDGGDMDIWSAGINWWASPYMNINMNYRYITLDRFGLEGTSHGFNMRLMLVLE